MVKLSVISDDLTGGCAVGAEFARFQIPVSVTGKLASIPRLAAKCDVLVFNTETRNRAARDAAGICAEAAAVIASVGSECVVKKIDSLLRGSIAEEIDAIANAFGFDRCLLIAAAPSVGRTTLHGVQYVDGVRLQDALQEADPSSVPLGSQVISFLEGRTVQALHTITIDDIEAGDAHLAGKLAAIDGGIVIADATEEKHIYRLVDAAFGCGVRFFAGTYGIGTPLARCLDFGHSDGQILVISGSLSHQSRKQVEMFAAQAGCTHVTIDLQCGMDDSKVEALTSRAYDQVRRASAAGDDVIITTSADAQCAARNIQDIGSAAKLAMDRQLSSALLTVAGPMLVKCKGVVVSGGSTANAFLAALGADGLSMKKQEILPGTPLSVISGGSFDGLFFLTKPGSYGDERALVEARNILKRITGKIQ